MAVHCVRVRGAEEGSRDRAECREANGLHWYASEELKKDPEIVLSA